MKNIVLILAATSIVAGCADVGNGQVGFSFDPRAEQVKAQRERTTPYRGASTN